MNWFDAWYESLVSFRPASARQAADKRIVLEEVDRRRDLFDRHLNPCHCTASAIIIGSRGLILHNHKKFGIWIQPGGHIDKDESPWDCAIRESFEETGLEVVHPSSGPYLLHISCHVAGDRYHMDFQYLLIGEDRDPIAPAGESQEIGWFGLVEAKSLADHSMAESFESLMHIDLSLYLDRIETSVWRR